MSNDKQKDSDPPSGRDDEEAPNRDARGRWAKGHCPNPNGRPRKKPTEQLDHADIYVFMNTMIEVAAGGEKRLMTRREALLAKMYEDAMKGKVTAQRHLYREFERNDERLAAAKLYYERLMYDWIIDNPRYTDRDFEMPIEVETEILKLRSVLNHYFPGSYPINGHSEEDD